jgi:hypothetical protein
MDWKALYKAAMRETNKRAIPRLVSEAESAVISRSRELAGTTAAPEEKEALEDALYGLRALRTASQIPEAA